MSEKDPTIKVYRNFTQAELDAQYNNRDCVPDWTEIGRHNRSESKRVRRILASKRDVPYGPSPDEVLDIFPPRHAPAPIQIYFHGGGWRVGSKNGCSYLAEWIVPAGAAFIAVEFGLVPSISLDEMIRRCRAAIVWIWQNAESFGGDRNRIFVSGHSSGAHVGAMMTITDWEKSYDLPADIVKGATLFSGMYDLEPVRLSFRNEDLALDPTAAERNTPLHHIPDRGCPLVVGCGGLETAEFRRQSREFAEAWRRSGHTCTFVELPGLHHFAVGEEFHNPKGDLLTAMFEQMAL